MHAPLRLLPVQDKKAPQIPANTHECPLALHGTQATQQELAKSHRVLDDAKDRFYGGLTLRVKGLSSPRLQTMRCRLNRGGIVRSFWIFAKAFGQG